MKASTTNEGGGGGGGVIQMLYTLWGDRVNATVRATKIPAPGDT